MSDTFEKIIASAPISRTAAVVTNQKEVTDTVELPRLESLQLEFRLISDRMAQLPKKSAERKVLASKITLVQQQIVAERQRLGIRPGRRRPQEIKAVEQAFVDIAKQRLNAFEFKRWMKDAEKLLEEGKR